MVEFGDLVITTENRCRNSGQFRIEILIDREACFDDLLNNIVSNLFIKSNKTVGGVKHFCRVCQHKITSLI